MDGSGVECALALLFRVIVSGARGLNRSPGCVPQKRRVGRPHRRVLGRVAVGPAGQIERPITYIMYSQRRSGAQMPRFARAPFPCSSHHATDSLHASLTLRGWLD
jgi:hypothetical protein